MSQSQPPDELEELMPWHVNGTLDEPSERRMEQLLAQNPASREDVALLAAVAAAVRQDHRSYDEQGTLTSLLKRIAPATSKVVASKYDSASKSWFDALFSWFEPKFALAVLTIGIQAVVIGALVSRPDRTQPSEVRSQTQVSATAQPMYRITFAPSTAERDIRSLLLAAHAQIVQGPTQLGDYYLALVGSQSSASETVLRQSKLVDSMSKVDRIPTQ